MLFQVTASLSSCLLSTIIVQQGEKKKVLSYANNGIRGVSDAGVRKQLPLFAPSNLLSGKKEPPIEVQ